MAKHLQVFHHDGFFYAFTRFEMVHYSVNSGSQEKNIMIRQLQFAIFALACFLATPGIQAQVVYMNESLVPTNPNHEIFNNNIGGETEDNWVANSFVVVSGGTRLQSISFLLAAALTNKPVTVAIYTGSSLTNPKASTGLSRIVASTTTVSLSAAAFTADDSAGQSCGPRSRARLLRGTPDARCSGGLPPIHVRCWIDTGGDATGPFVFRRRPHNWCRV